MRAFYAGVTLALVGVGLVGGGCGGDDAKHGTECDLPGERGECACEDGSEGIWVCGEDHRWGECNCGSDSEGGATGSGGASDGTGGRQGGETGGVSGEGAGGTVPTAGAGQGGVSQPATGGQSEGGAAGTSTPASGGSSGEPGAGGTAGIPGSIGGSAGATATGGSDVGGSAGTGVGGSAGTGFGGSAGSAVGGSAGSGVGGGGDGGAGGFPGGGAGGPAGGGAGGAAGGGSRPTLPDITNGNDGFTTRYWDCCKPHCAWPDNVSPGDSPAPSCNVDDEILSDANAMSGCETNGSAYLCHSYAPWAVSEDVAYGFAAYNAGSCGDCFHLQFTGVAHPDSPDAGSEAIQDKHLVVQVITIGEIQPGQFDLLIPGGGFGALNGCDDQFPGVDLGAQYGGMLADCANDSNPAQCVRDMCEAAFPAGSDIRAGCLWQADWLQVANSPEVVYEPIDCPDEIVAISGLGG